MKVIVNVIYDKDDRVSCPNRKKFENVLIEHIFTSCRVSLLGFLKKLDVSCISMNLYEDQYVQKKDS